MGENIGSCICGTLVYIHSICICMYEQNVKSLAMKIEKRKDIPEPVKQQQELHRSLRPHTPPGFGCGGHNCRLYIALHDISQLYYCIALHNIAQLYMIMHCVILHNRTYCNAQTHCCTKLYCLSGCKQWCDCAQM